MAISTIVFSACFILHGQRFASIDRRDHIHVARVHDRAVQSCGNGVGHAVGVDVLSGRHVRNLTDEQFKALCEIGGTAGLNLYGAFLRDDGRPTLEDVWRHIEHFLELGGEGHIALGGDLDGCDVLPKGFTGVNDYEKLERMLEEKKLAAPVIENIFSESLLKVVKQCIM